MIKAFSVASCLKGPATTYSDQLILGYQYIVLGQLSKEQRKKPDQGWQ
jgi:hypothetical protein